MSDPIAIPSDLEFIKQHRKIWEERPELRSVYYGFFEQLLNAIEKRSPIVEIGTGPGFFKEYHPALISTDVISTSWADVICDGCALPFASGSVGAIVALDVLHHLPRPLEFVSETARVLQPGGVVAMIEPWITPASYLLYRYFHHEDCKLGIDIRNPFTSNDKNAFDGNATIPFHVARSYRHNTEGLLRLIRVEPFLGLPFLATFGFQRARPMSARLIRASYVFEKLLGRLGRWNATRALLVWQKLA